MATITKLNYGEETSVRVADYQYYKPRLEITVSFDETEDFDTVLEDTKNIVRSRLDKIEREIYKREREKKGGK